MNWQIFSVIGYISVGAWVLMLVFWGLHWLIRPRRWFVHLALIAGLAALFLAGENSSSHITRLQADNSEKLKKHMEEMEAKRKRKESERAEDVANIRFAEDSREDFLDKAGMDEGERAYYESIGKKDPKKKGEAPAWKREKKKRDTSATEAEGLEASIGGVEETEGVNVEGAEPKEEEKPIIMAQKHVDMAYRLDDLNLRIIRILLVVGVLLLLYDYLRRCNVYRESYLPLPLPNGLVNTMTPLSPVVEPEKKRRPVRKELLRMVRQGGTFLYLCDKRDDDDSLPSHASRWPLGLGKVEVLPTTYEGDDISPEFVLDALWFGRCAFTVDDREKAESLLNDLIALLVDRRGNRAHARKNVHLVWNMSEPPPDVLLENVKKLGPSTGISLFVAG